MATDIDSLQIQINAQATKASASIDSLVKKIDRLSASLSTLDGHGLRSLASGVNQLGAAMQIMNNVKTTEFTRLAKNLTTLNNLDVSKLSNASANISKIGTAVSGLSGVSTGVTQITALANGIKQLGYKSADKAIANIPQLATAMKKLMSELSKAPKVSQNLIDMTNALAKLARTGASSGRAAQSLSTAFNGVHKSSGFATKGIQKVNISLNGLLKQLAPYVGIWQLFSFGKQAMEISSDLTEVQNVVDVTFGDFKQKIEDLASVSILELGMSELTTKEIASRFQAMGTAMGFSKEKMSDMSVELTRLTGDMASFYNVEQEDVGKALQSIFTGETEPMRKYGVDLTNATIQQWALNNGISVSVNKLTQAQKAMLRYQYVMENTEAAQGDFLRTQDTWANQVRILKQQLQQLASVIGGSLINALKPFVKALNTVISHVIAFAKTVSDALGKIFGWKYEVGGGITSDLEDGSDASDDIADGIGDAADNAKKLKNELMGFDEINKLSDDTTSSGSSIGTGSSGTAGADGGNWVQTDSMFKEFESEIDSLSKLGEYIRDALIKAMGSIKWEDIYKKASGFGTGLAQYLNGLFSADKDGNTVFGSLGTTIAGVLNTLIYSVFSFSEEFEWADFGKALKDGIQKFINTAGLATAGYTVGNLVKGIATSVYTAVSDVNTWKSLGTKIGEGINGFFNSMGTKDKKTGLTGWETLGKTISSTIGGLAKSMTTALKTVKWTEVGQAIGTFISEIDFSKIAWDLLSLASELCGAIAKAIVGYVETDPIGTAIVGMIAGAKLVGLNTKLSSAITTYFGSHNLSLGKVAIGLSLGLATFKLLDSNDTIQNMVAAPITAALAGITVTANPIVAIVLGGVTLAIGAGMNLGKLVAQKVAENVNEKYGEGTADVDAIGNLTLSQAMKLDLGIKKIRWNAVGGNIIDYIVESFKTNVGVFNFTIDALFDFKISENAESGEEIISESAKKYYERYGESAGQTMQKAMTGQLDVESPIKTALGDAGEKISEWWGDKKVEIGAWFSETKESIDEWWINVKYWWGEKKELAVSLVKNGWTTVKDWVTKNIGGNIEKGIGLLRNGWTTVKNWITSKFFGAGVFKNIGLKRNGWTTVKNWITSKFFGAGVFKKVGLQNNGFGTVYSWIVNNFWGGGIWKNVGLQRNGWTTVSEWITKNFLGNALTLGISLVTGGGKADGGIYANGSWKPITAFAGGGLPGMGQVFVAREAGPELVGTIGGHTAVMNNNQIVSSVAAGVASAVAGVMSQFSGNSSPEVHVYVGGKEITDYVVKDVNQRTIATGACPIMT